MNTRIIKYLLLPLIMSSCAGTHYTSSKREITVYLGAAHGGIIENTDFSVYDNVQPDAYSGATSIGGSTGLRYSIPLGRNSIFSGIDWIGNSQSFTYDDPENHYSGHRDFFTQQIRVPLQYSLHIINKACGDPWLKLNIGFSAGMIFGQIRDSEGDLPDYEISGLSTGPVMGIEFYPFKFRNNSSAGFYAEFFRSMQKSYNDFYQLGEMPGISYLKFGIAFKFPSAKQQISD